MLARRIVHERHLAGKLRQGLAFVEGSIVDVTVTFQAPAPPRLPAAAPSPTSQRIADANAPAEVGDVAAGDHAFVDLPDEPSPEATEGFPATILVSLAVPEPFYAAARSQAGSAADPEAVDLATEERLRDHVLGLLPPTTRADGRQVLMTRFAVGETQSAAGQPRRLGDRSAAAATDGPGRDAGEVVSLEAAWRAILAGRAEDVPREVWLGVIAVAAGLLGWLVLRPQRSSSRQPSGRPPAHRIDWSEIDDDAATAGPAAPRRQVAA